MHIEMIEVIKNELIAKDTYEMILKPEKMTSITAGQFINIKLPGVILRRPFSVASINEDTYTILYKVLGQGTDILSNVKINAKLDVLLPLGQGFTVNKEEKEILIIGGGIGIAPLYELAKEYAKLNTKITAVLGFDTKESVYYEEEFKALGAKVYISSDDGSVGVKGHVLDAIEYHNISEDYVYACGPQIMLKAVQAKYKRGYISLEERMGCGIGACMSCVCKANNADELYYRICKEGPVFEIGKVNL